MFCGACCGARGGTCWFCGVPLFGVACCGALFGALFGVLFGVFCGGVDIPIRVPSRAPVTY